MKFMTFDDLQKCYEKLTPDQIELWNRLEELEGRLDDLMRDIRQFRREIAQALDL